MPVADLGDRGAADPGLVAQGPHEVARPCGRGTPSIHAWQITAYRALPTRRRGWSREGKKDPVRSLGIAGSTSPARWWSRGLEALAVALRRARRGAARRSRRRPRTPTGPVRPGPEQTAQDARPAKSGSARTSRISMDTAHWFVAGIAGALLVNPAEEQGSHDARRPPGPAGPLDAEGPAGIATTL